MDVHSRLREVDSYCPACGDVVAHDVFRSDPGACTCSACGGVQTMMVPLEA